MSLDIATFFEGIKRLNPSFSRILIVASKKTQETVEATINIRQQKLMSFEELMVMQIKPKILLILDGLDAVS